MPLYFAAERPVVVREGAHCRATTSACRLQRAKCPEFRRVRFRTLGCYPLTGAIESDAASLDDIVAEMLAAHTSERQGRLIDTDETASMERKKKEGYF